MQLPHEGRCAAAGPQHMSACRFCACQHACLPAAHLLDGQQGQEGDADCGGAHDAPGGRGAPVLNLRAGERGRQTTGHPGQALASGVLMMKAYCSPRQKKPAGALARSKRPGGHCSKFTVKFDGGGGLP